MIFPIGQTVSGTRLLSQDAAEQDTVLPCRYRTVGRLEGSGCTEDQIMVVVQRVL